MNANAPSAWLRATLGIGLPLLLLLAAVLPFWLFHARLPDPLAVHWNFRGQPDGAMRLGPLVALVVVMVAAPAALMTAMTRRRDARRGEIGVPLAIAGFVAGLSATMSWVIVIANLDAAAWRQAGHLHVLTSAVPLLLSAALSRTLVHAARPLESALPNIDNKPSIGLAPGARGMWMGTARSVWAVPMMIGFLIFGVVMAGWKPLPGVIFGLAGMFAGLAFVSLRVTVDHGGVRIAYGALGVPVQRVKLTDIQHATVLQINPLAWGGWGYRGSLRMLGRAAVVLRRGEGLRLDLAGERVLVITVDDAAAAAGLINDLLAGRRTRPD